MEYAIHCLLICPLYGNPREISETFADILKQECLGRNKVALFCTGSKKRTRRKELDYIAMNCFGDAEVLSEAEIANGTSDFSYFILLMFVLLLFAGDSVGNGANGTSEQTLTQLAKTEISLILGNKFAVAEANIEGGKDTESLLLRWVDDCIVTGLPWLLGYKCYLRTQQHVAVSIS